MPEGVEGWKLRENDHYHCHHSYELIQFHGSIGKNVGIHDLCAAQEKEKTKKHCFRITIIIRQKDIY